jgi:AraC-like DNA-binding protein
MSSEFAADFRAHQRLIQLGEIRLYPVTFQQTLFERTPKLIRQSDPEGYNLSLLLSGGGGATWGRQEITYGVDEFHTSCTSMPFRVWSGTHHVTMIGVEIPRTLLPFPRCRADQIVGHHLSAREGFGALLAQFLTQMASDTSPYQPTDGPRLGAVLADLVAGMFAHTLDADNHLPPETRTHTLTLRIKAFIRQNLGDPGLTPDAIAAVHHISRSLLYRLFQAENTTVAGYIRHHRLEGARADLANPALRATPVHVIAARWGFPRAADFTRAFRNAYQTTPTELRRLNQLCMTGHPHVLGAGPQPGHPTPPPDGNGPSAYLPTRTGRCR